MIDRPAQLWKALPLEKRVLVADAFWRDKDSPGVDAQKVEAMMLLARRLNFRPKSISSLPLERRARQLAQIIDVSDTLATRALVAYHFAHQRPLMSAFLDTLGIAHDQGLVSDEQVGAPGAERLVKAVTAVRATFDSADVDLYLRTLAALDGDTWGGLDAVLDTSARPAG